MSTSDLPTELLQILRRAVQFRNSIKVRMHPGEASERDTMLYWLSGQLVRLIAHKDRPSGLINDCLPLLGKKGLDLEEELSLIVSKHYTLLFPVDSLADKQELPKSQADHKIDIQYLDDLIFKYQLDSIWGDSFEAISSAESERRVISRRNEAIVAYRRMMASPRNDGSVEYKDWAARKALEIPKRRGYSAQPTGGKNWRAWGR